MTVYLSVYPHTMKKCTLGQSVQRYILFHPFQQNNCLYNCDAKNRFVSLFFNNQIYRCKKFIKSNGKLRENTNLASANQILMIDAVEPRHGLTISNTIKPSIIIYSHIFTF